LDISPEPETTAKPPETAPHKFLRYAAAKPVVNESSRLAAYILNSWTGKELSVSKYRTLRDLKLVLTRDGVAKDVNIRFEDLIEHIRETRSFQSGLFGLPPLQSDWLDSSLGISKPDGPIVNADSGEFAKFALSMPFGEDFPIQPCIDREGAAFNSYHSAIQENIVTLHRRLVSTSHEAPSLSNNWRNDLRMLLNESVSIVDISLHQLYFMAQYRGKEFGWNFDLNALGQRHGMRLTDKLKWIGKITGRPLDDARDEVAALNRLKSVRNHFNHFDPPCIAYTLEDLAGWLNDVPGVGRLLWKIRDKLRTQIGKGIVEIITLPVVEFVPKNSLQPRHRQPVNVGYASSIWPGDSKSTI